MTTPIYLDYNATTPCDERVVEEMAPYFCTHFGNAASRTHQFGQVAHRAVDVARNEVANLIGAKPHEIVLTSGATESDNIATVGVAWANENRGRHIITSPIEHSAVLDPARWLVQRGFDVTFVEPDPDGRISLEKVQAARRDDTILVSVMLANNEIGAISPIREIATWARENGIISHTDAAQAAGKIPVDVDDLGVDLMSISGHKLYGPKGIGALYVRDGKQGCKVEPIVRGGGHENGLRSGTLAVPLIVGFGAACRIARESVVTECARIRELAEHFRRTLSEGLPVVEFNGPEDPNSRLPGLVSARIPGLDAGTMLLGCPELAVSTSSACSSASGKASHVLTGVGLSEDEARSTVRIGVGRLTSVEELDYAAGRFAEAAALFLPQ